MAFSAFLSTENDLHHNLRPNIGGYTSRHNTSAPSDVNGRGRVFSFCGRRKVTGGRRGERGLFKSFKEEGRERKGKRVRRSGENVIIITLIVVII